MMPYLLQKTLSQPPARPAGTRTESFAISSPSLSPIENADQQVPEMVASAGVGSSPIQSNHRQQPQQKDYWMLLQFHFAVEGS